MKKLLLILALLFVCTNVQAQYPKHCPSDGQFVTWANADTQFVCSVAVLPISYTKVTHQWLDSYNSATGLFTSSQPNFTDLSGTISTSTQMPNSGVTAGSYTNTNLTVNAQGLVTAASNGSAGSGGAWTLVEQHTISSSTASMDFTTCISSTYDTYDIELLYFVPVTNGSSIYSRVSTDGGSTWDSTAAHYLYEVWQFQSGFNSIIGSASATQMQFSGGVSSTASNGGFSGSFRFFNPADSTHYKAITLLQSSRPISSDGNPYAGQGMGAYKQTAAFNAIQFFFSSGNIASGVGRCYGISK